MQELHHTIEVVKSGFNEPLRTCFAPAVSRTLPVNAARKNQAEASRRKGPASSGSFNTFKPPPQVPTVLLTRGKLTLGIGWRWKLSDMAF